MDRGKVLRISVLILLLIGMYVSFSNWHQAKEPRPVPQVSQEQSADKAAGQPAVQPPADGAPTSQRLELPPDSSNYSPAATAIADCSYRLKKERNERQITPGVAYVPGQGLNIKLNAKDQVIHISKNQLLWQKNF